MSTRQNPTPSEDIVQTATRHRDGGEPTYDRHAPDHDDTAPSRSTPPAPAWGAALDAVLASWARPVVVRPVAMVA